MKQATEQSDGEAFLALAHELAVCATQPDMADAAHRLMGLTQKAAPHRAQEVAQILVRAGTPASRPYLALVAALDTAAPLEPGVARFMANRQRARALLQAALAAVPDAEAISQKLRMRLARILWQIGDEEGLSDLVSEVATRAKQGGHDHAELAKLALICMGTRHGSALRDAVRIAAEREPNSPEVLQAHMRGLVADRQSIEVWWPLLKQIVVDHPDDVGFKRFAASCAYNIGEWGFAEELQQSHANELNDPINWENAGLAALRMGHEERAITWLSRARPRVPSQRVGPLAPILERLLEALNHDYHWGDVLDHQVLKQELDSSLEQLRRTLSATDYAPSDLLQAANAIHTVEAYPFYTLEQIVKRHPHVPHWDARYGTFDLRAYGVVWRALVEHKALLLDHGLTWMLGEAPLGTLNALRESTEKLTEARLMLDEPEATMQTLRALTSAGCNGLFFQELLDRCLLHRSNVAEVRTRVQARPSTDLRNAKVGGVAQFSEWIERER
jgi:tetratricopeptide (TPR) repeat protein